MTTDRELLEKAAKAAGISLEPEGNEIGRASFEGDGLYKYHSGGFVSWKWRPLRDDGDALRLLNVLGLQLRHVHGKAHAGVPDRFWCTENWFPDGDRDAATRRAIVRAAAAIGEQQA